jgi:Zn-dependent protease
MRSPDSERQPADPPPDIELAEPNDETASSPPPNQSSAAMRGSFRLCRFAGIDVFVHWTWFIAAWYLISDSPAIYSSIVWNIVEYVALFELVLLHEFGHVFACRWVGGTANRVVLWPLGGLAFVSPPPRPGANFWTTLAGPLVNLSLAPALYSLKKMTGPGLPLHSLDLHQLMMMLTWFNLAMIVFNMLPVYPLDGGRLLHAVLWKCFGYVPGLRIAAGVGVCAGAALLSLAIAERAFWLGMTAAFISLGALAGLYRAELVSRLLRAKCRRDKRCPNCGTAPPKGPFWRCARCMKQFDLFDPSEACPKGDGHVSNMPCLACGRPSPLSDWEANSL